MLRRLLAGLQTWETFRSAKQERNLMTKLAELARLIKADLMGEPDAEVTRARPFELASEGDVTLALDTAYAARVNESRATAVIVSAPITASSGNLLVARDPKLAFARAIEALHKTEYEPIGVSGDLIAGRGTVFGEDLSIHPRVTIGRDAVIGNRVTLNPGVVIGDRCSIGDDTVVHANVSIYRECEIGSRVIIHAGTVIGADGFGFVPDELGHQVKLLQLGRVRIEDDCEIGANCAIDRGGFGDTVLRRGVKLDNLVQVGHNCEIGEDTVVAALAGFSGGTRVGRGCVVAGQVGTNQHTTIGDGATLTGRTAVTKNVRAGAVVAGMPAQDYNAWRRSQVLYSKLPGIVDRLKHLERIVEGLTRPSEKSVE
jgi:UDP-3-O-[3-hydroxymyristoyl] glucosamine N-acyltransferase